MFRFYLSLFFLCLLVLSGCGKGGGGPGGPPQDFAMEVIMQKPASTNVEEVLSAVGTIEANEQVELRPKTAGLIDQILFTEGQRVEKGMTLFTLDKRKEEASLAQAIAEQKIAEANKKRAAGLAGSKAISQQELEQLESIESVKRSTQLVEAETLGEREIKAPFAGIIGARTVSLGQYVAAGTTLAKLVDDSKVKVYFRVPEKNLGNIRLKQTGRIRVSPFPDRTFEGIVDLIEPIVDEQTRTVQVRLLVPNEQRVLKAGLFARVELVTTNRANSLVIPEGALIASLEQFSAYVAENGKASLKKVQVGVRLPGLVEILAGLTPDSDVIVSGTQKIVEGMKVVAPKKPLQTNSPAPKGN